MSQLTEQRLHTPWQQKVFSKLLGLSYKIIYRKGTENRAADALSRYPVGVGSCYLGSTTTVAGRGGGFLCKGRARSVDHQQIAPGYSSCSSFYIQQWNFCGTSLASGSVKILLSRHSSSLPYMPMRSAGTLVFQSPSAVLSNSLLGKV